MTRYKINLLFVAEAEKDVDVAEGCSEACEMLAHLFEPDSITVRWERVEEKKEE